MHQYGLSRPDYETMVAVYRRDGCPICGERTGRGVVDHQHGTKRARGMVCDRCNQALGFFRDSADVCARAASYLTRGDWRLAAPVLVPATPATATTDRISDE